MSYSDEERINLWEAYLDSPYGEDAWRKIQASADRDEPVWTVDFGSLERFDADFAQDLIENPDKSLLTAQETCQRVAPVVDPNPRFRVRVRNVSSDPLAIGGIRAAHTNRVVRIIGMATMVTEVQPRILLASYECVRCATVIGIECGPEYLEQPLECYEDQGGCKRSANATRFVLRSRECVRIDSQPVELQDPPEQTRGASPARIIALFEGSDFVGRIRAAARVEVSAVVRVRLSPSRKPRTAETLYLDVVGIEEVERRVALPDDMGPSPAEEAAIRHLAADPDIHWKLARSLAPTIFGHDAEKMAITLQLFGGVPLELPEGRRVRGDIHILLVGDPGTVKSALLMAAADAAPWSVTASADSTAAGLTAAMEKADIFGGRWVVRPGAMARADGGWVFIDEFDKIREEDRSHVHSALEPQVYPVNKAGHHYVFYSRCAALCAANPKHSRFDETKYIADQLDFSPALLSRFDCIFPVSDVSESKYDMDLANAILSVHREGGHAQEPEVNRDLFRKYIIHARHKEPGLTAEASALIAEFWVAARKAAAAEGAIAMTARQLESAVRFAQASARIRLSSVVGREDAELAVQVMESWMRLVAREGGIYDIDGIATGMSHSQREQAVILRNVVAECAGEGSAGESDILEVARSRGLSADRVMAWLERWRNEGEVFSPSEGRYKLVTRL